jgi:hypothetical protein
MADSGVAVSANHLVKTYPGGVRALDATPLG